jgi:predicted amidohydrolase
MDEFVTTCVQQQIRVFESHGEFRNDIQRFMRLAKIKESRLVIFPELSGLLLAPPLVPGLKRTLLRVAERQVKRKPSLIDRMVGRIANSATEALGGIGGHIMDTFISRADTLRDAYLTIFSETAREYEMHILGGSIYLPDARDGQIHNTAYLFGPTGEVIGQQSKITLGFADTLFCKPATTGLQVFDTDFGKLGILIGQDVLFPESGRILSALGAIAVAHLVAAPGLGTFSKLRTALAARLQENLLLGAQSCLVGKNIVSPKNEKNDYVGKSAILAPPEMTTRFSGLLGEVGSTVTDGVISAAWDLKGLYELRSTIDIPSHEPLRNEVLRRQMQALYGLSPAMEAPASSQSLEYPSVPVASSFSEPATAIATGIEETPRDTVSEQAEPTALSESNEQLSAASVAVEDASQATGSEPIVPGPQPTAAADMAMVRIEELPPLPLVYDEVALVPSVLEADAEAAPPEFTTSRPEEATIVGETHDGEEGGDEIAPEATGEAGPTPAVPTYNGLWPALDEFTPWSSPTENVSATGILQADESTPAAPADEESELSTTTSESAAADLFATGASSDESPDGERTFEQADESAVATDIASGQHEFEPLRDEAPPKKWWRLGRP